MSRSAAVRRLVEDRNLRLSLGEGARKRVAEIALWDRKVDRMDSLYATVLREANG